MPNRILQSLYKGIYHEDFNYSSFEHRFKMQKGMFLLQELGVNIGEYKFTWYMHGLYSSALMNDMADSIKVDDIQFTSYTKESLDAVYNALILPSDISYNEREWIDCVSSMRYIKDSYCPSNTPDEEIIITLSKKQPHLNDNVANLLALATIKKLFS